MQETIHHRQAFWHSRRGMLELDLLLVPFVQHEYANLSSQQQSEYHLLLECEDSDIYAWLMQREKPEEKVLADMIDQIIKSNLQRNARNEGQSTGPN